VQNRGARKKNLPAGSSKKHCEACQTRDRENQKAQRTRKAEEPEKTVAGKKRKHNDTEESEGRDRVLLRTETNVILEMKMMTMKAF
jgi:hypothetical protein